VVKRNVKCALLSLERISALRTYTIRKSTRREENLHFACKINFEAHISFTKFVNYALNPKSHARKSMSRNLIHRTWASPNNIVLLYV
jgi:hypothetical protein